jgi:hypothetical protein
MSGAVAWVLADERGEVIHQGAAGSRSQYPSVFGLEYEGLLCGLKQAAALKVSHLLIKNTSDDILTQISRGSAGMSGNLMYNPNKEILSSVTSFLSLFDLVDFELIPAEMNVYAYRLAQACVAQNGGKRESTSVNPPSGYLTGMMKDLNSFPVSSQIPHSASFSQNSYPSPMTQQNPKLFSLDSTQPPSPSSERSAATSVQMNERFSSDEISFDQFNQPQNQQYTVRPSMNLLWTST